MTKRKDTAKKRPYVRPSGVSFVVTPIVNEEAVIAAIRIFLYGLPTDRERTARGLLCLDENSSPPSTNPASK